MRTVDGRRTETRAPPGQCACFSKLRTVTHPGDADAAAAAAPGDDTPTPPRPLTGY